MSASVFLSVGLRSHVGHARGAVQVRKQLAAMLNKPLNLLSVENDRVGGAYGGKAYDFLPFVPVGFATDV